MNFFYKLGLSAASPEIIVEDIEWLYEAQENRGSRNGESYLEHKLSLTNPNNRYEKETLPSVETMLLYDRISVVVNDKFLLNRSQISIL